MSPRLRKLAIALLLLAVAAVTAVAFGLEPVRRRLVERFSRRYERDKVSGPIAPHFDGADAKRERRAIALELVAKGLTQPTDIQFPPGRSDVAVVLEKTGDARWLALASGNHGELFHVDVLTASEEGLLGLAFHPGFASNGRIFINYVAKVGDKDMTRVAEWKLNPPADLQNAEASAVRVLLEVEQPYQNHNAGQLAFGPDGMLYIGLGDGGFRDDPKGNGQNPGALLGKMLRIDVNGASDQKPYRVPPDNPFLAKPEFKPEIWAWGLRNPWRYAFDPQGRLIVADVGQDRWEELHIVQAGDNLGWQVREGLVCARKEKDAPGCEPTYMIEPFFVYGRGDGASITGGYVYTGTRVPALRGLYVFGDFVSGRLFALSLPADRATRIAQPIALGRWPLLPSTFGRDAAGELYVATFANGDIYRIGPADSKK
jgi:glucose/arabinose dehydrogenase